MNPRASDGYSLYIAIGTAREAMGFGNDAVLSILLFSNNERNRKYRSELLNQTCFVACYFRDIRVPSHQAMVTLIQGSQDTLR